MTQRLFFAESWRVFQRIWRCTLLIGGIHFVLIIAALVPQSTDYLNSLLPSQDELPGSFQYIISHSSAWISFSLWTVFSFVAYREHFGLKDREILSPFMKYCVGAVVLAVISGLLVDGLLYPLPELLISNEVTQRFFVSSEVTQRLIVPILMLADWIMPTMFICFIGSWLPAAILQKDLSVIATVRRGMRQFFWTLGRFILGPGIFLLAGITGIFVIVYFGATPGNMGFESTNPVILVFAYSLGFVVASIAWLSMAYCKVMIAVILSGALLRDEERAPDAGNRLASSPY